MQTTPGGPRYHTTEAGIPWFPSQVRSTRALQRDGGKRVREVSRPPGCLVSTMLGKQQRTPMPSQETHIQDSSGINESCYDPQALRGVGDTDQQHTTIDGMRGGCSSHEGSKQPGGAVRSRSRFARRTCTACVCCTCNAIPIRSSTASAPTHCQHPQGVST